MKRDRPRTFERQISTKNAPGNRHAGPRANKDELRLRLDPIRSLSPTRFPALAVPPSPLLTDSPVNGALPGTAAQGRSSAGAQANGGHAKGGGECEGGVMRLPVTACLEKGKGKKARSNQSR